VIPRQARTQSRNPPRADRTSGTAQWTQNKILK